MRFYEPMNFLLLLGVLLLGLFVFWTLARKKRLLARFGDIPLLMKNSPYISFARQRTKAIILLLALCFAALALARLQFGTHLEEVKREGLDLIVAIDVSQSMMARDMQPNRLEKAKQEVFSVIDRLRGDRIGIVAFAGLAHTQCPLTIDYAAARMMLSVVDNSSAGQQGTSLAAAMETAARSFEKKEKKHKVLLLLTDGEDFEGRAEEVAESIRSEGVRVYTVGIGNPAGEPIPIIDREGNQIGFKKDSETGDVVMSRLDEATLQRISLITGGKYYHATAGEMELDRIFEEIARMEKKELEGSLVTRYDDRFQWPLLIALLLVVGEFFVSERKKPIRSVVDE